MGHTAMIHMTSAMKAIYPGVDFSLTCATEKTDPELLRLEPRRKSIIKLLTGHAGMTSGELSGKTKTSKNTARKDLLYLYNKGVLKRTSDGRGGQEKNIYFLPSH